MNEFNNESVLKTKKKKNRLLFVPSIYMALCWAPPIGIKEKRKGYH